MSIRKKGIRILLLALVVAALCVVPAFASSSAGNVADAVEQTWTDAAGQITGHRLFCQTRDGVF